MRNLLVFTQTFEALERALGDRLTPELKQRLRAVGVDYDAPLLPAYPYQVWAEAMTLAAETLFPDAPPAERPDRLGQRFLDSYSETLVGKALMAVIRIIGPRRTLERMARNMRTANNYTEVQLSPVEDGTFRLTFNHVLVPAFYRGLVQRGLEISGAKTTSVVLEKHEGENGTFRVSWT